MHGVNIQMSSTKKKPWSDEPSGLNIIGLYIRERFELTDRHVSKYTDLQT